MVADGRHEKRLRADPYVSKSYVGQQREASERHAHAYKLQNFVVAVHETSVREPSRDPNPNQRRDDHPGQGQRGDRAPRECLAQAQAKARKHAAKGYQADRDARCADEAGRVEDRGQWRLAIWRDGPEPRFFVARRGQEERFERIYERDYERQRSLLEWA